MSYASVADAEFAFLFGRWEACNGFVKRPRDLEGDCWTAGTLADTPPTPIYRETVADFGLIPGIFSWLSFNTTYKPVALENM